MQPMTHTRLSGSRVLRPVSRSDCFFRFRVPGFPVQRARFFRFGSPRPRSRLRRQSQAFLPGTPVVPVSSGIWLFGFGSPSVRRLRFGSVTPGSLIRRDLLSEGLIRERLPVTGRGCRGPLCCRSCQQALKRRQWALVSLSLRSLSRFCIKRQLITPFTLVAE